MLNKEACLACALEYLEKEREANGRALELALGEQQDLNQMFVNMHERLWKNGQSVCCVRMKQRHGCGLSIQSLPPVGCPKMSSHMPQFRKRCSGLSKSVCRQCKMSSGRTWCASDDRRWRGDNVACPVGAGKNEEGLIWTYAIPDGCRYSFEHLLFGQRWLRRHEEKKEKRT